jgi:hypothetical protein
MRVTKDDVSQISIRNRDTSAAERGLFRLPCLLFVLFVFWKSVRQSQNTRMQYGQAGKIVVCIKNALRSGRNHSAKAEKSVKLAARENQICLIQPVAISISNLSMMSPPGCSTCAKDATTHFVYSPAAVKCRALVLVLPNNAVAAKPA